MRRDELAVTMTICPSYDRRANQVVLTKQGADVVGEIAPIWQLCSTASSTTPSTPPKSRLSSHYSDASKLRPAHPRAPLDPGPWIWWRGYDLNLRPSGYERRDSCPQLGKTRDFPVDQGFRVTAAPPYFPLFTAALLHPRYMGTAPLAPRGNGGAPCLHFLADRLARMATFHQSPFAGSRRSRMRSACHLSRRSLPPTTAGGKGYYFAFPLSEIEPESAEPLLRWLLDRLANVDSTAPVKSDPNGDGPASRDDNPLWGAEMGRRDGLYAPGLGRVDLTLANQG